MSIRFTESDARDMAARPRRVGSVPDRRLCCQPCGGAGGATLLVASENGIGKRSQFEEYRVQSRGGKGIITMKTTEKTARWSAPSSFTRVTTSCS
jgi:DNA gyrase subunit A